MAYCNIIGGCSQIAKGIGEERNDKCITGHGATNKKSLPTKSDIDICVSAVLHIIDIIHTIVMGEQIDITSTKIKFEKIGEEGVMTKVQLIYQHDKERGILISKNSQVAQII